MFPYLGDFDRTFSLLDEFRRRMDHAFEGIEPARALDGPHAALFDAGQALRLEVELPGMADKDVQLTLERDVLTVRGERKSDAPEGYAVHRRERTPLRFARSFALPAKVDPEKVTATMSNGVLVVELGKAAEAQPRQIQIKAS